MIRGYKKLFLIFFLLISCKTSPNNRGLKKYVHDDKLIIRKILKNNNSSSAHFLIFPRNLCRKCFNKIIKYFENKKKRGEVILLGANNYTIKRLNTIYRNSLHFRKGEFDDYDRLQSSYPKMMHGYVRYVETSPDTLIYQGKGKNKTKRTLDVLRFFIKRNK